MNVLRTTRGGRVLFPVLMGCLVVLFAVACAPLYAHASNSNSLNSLNSAAASSAKQVAITTNCPAAGTANAASLPSITLGSHPNIVYIVNEATAGTLKRYDIVTGTKTEVVKLANTSISEAQVSANGQWLLFVAHVSGQVKLQLVRMDGKFLQTLYCGTPNQAQWSTDQKYIVFQDTKGTLLLTVNTGALQVELAPTTNPSIHPRTWLDNTHVYIELQFVDGPPEVLAVLDITQGSNQNWQKLPVAFDATLNTPFCWDFDSSFDGKTLFTSQCSNISNTHPGPGPAHGPGVISSRPAFGGGPGSSTYTYLYVNQGQAFTTVRAVTSKTLLFLVANTSGDTSQNGLWKVGVDGSNPQLLARTPGSIDSQLNQFSQFPWSNVSRESSRYALQIVSTQSNNTTYTLEYGSLSGGAPTVFASITNVQLATVGWTTM
jgi:hypothetical protein